MIPYTLLVFVLGGLAYRACNIAFVRFIEKHTLSDAEAYIHRALRFRGRVS